MNKLEHAFADGKALLPFITCGDPNLETTAAIVRAMSAAGAGAVILGIPFSDPTAEGPLVQEANLRAFAAGVSTDGVFDLVRELRSDVSVPFVFMTYANVIFSYKGKDGIGAEAFIRTCSAIGVDGLIVCDLPYEEKEEFLPLCRENGVALISQIAPASEERIAKIASDAEGFLYVIPDDDPAALIATARAHQAAVHPRSRSARERRPPPGSSAGRRRSRRNSVRPQHRRARQRRRTIHRQPRARDEDSAGRMITNRKQRLCH